MASCLNELARYEDAERFLNAAGDIAEQDDAIARVSYWTQKGFVAAAFGRESDAFESFERAVHAVKDHSDVLQVTAVWTNYAFMAMRLGRTEFAKTCYERALLTARRNNLVWYIPNSCLDYAWLLMKMGQYPLANEYLLDALSYDTRVKIPLFDIALAAVGIPLALHMKDEKTLARCTRPHAIELAFMSGEPDRIGLIVAAFARLYAERKLHRKVQSLLHQAVNTVYNVSYAWDLPIEIARNGATPDIAPARRLLASRVALPCADVVKAHLQLFDAFVAKRRGHRKAYTDAQDAAARFDALHWNACADLARSILPEEQRLTTTEIRYDKPFSDIAVLTEREREVAELVLKGLTNRAIADELRISPHTVDSHVNAIMSRLGIRSRHQLADAFIQPSE